MKYNSKIFLRIGLVLLFILTMALLFPPYTIQNKTIKFYDFVFNPEIVTKKIDETFHYKIDSRKQNVTEKDTIDALNVKITKFIDTTINYVQLKKPPKYKIVGDYKFYLDAIEFFGENPEYFRKDIVKIQPYTITAITKPQYVQGQRQILVSQLIIEVIICFVFSGMLLLIVLMFRKNKTS